MAAACLSDAGAAKVVSGLGRPFQLEWCCYRFDISSGILMSITDLLRYFTAKFDFARRVYFDSHLSVDDRIVTPVDRSHATTTGDAQDRVLT